MEWWSILKIFWSAVALGAAVITIILLFRARGVLSWKRSLRAELSALERMRPVVGEPGKKGIDIIQTRCRKILNALSPELAELKNLPGYIQSIAACYYPGTERPELQVTIRAFLQSLDKSLNRLDRILKRPGFKRLRSLSIHRITSARQFYLKLGASPLYRGYIRYRTGIRQAARLRLLLFFDPLMWVAFLSNQLTILILVKYLMVDLYLYFGRLSLEAFEDPQKTDTEEEKIKENLEETLKELGSLEETLELPDDPQLRSIRNRLVGFPAILASDPSFADWKNAVLAAAEVIASRNFPESEKPLHEAAVGPILERSRCWLSTLSKGEEYLIARRFYQLRLITLFQAKNFSEQLLPELLRRFIEKTFMTYGWLKWPLKVYRWARKRSPWTIAIEVGWQAAKKASLAHLYGKTFDKACREIEIIYRESSD